MFAEQCKKYMSYSSYKLLRVLSLSKVFVEVSLKPIYPIMVGKIFKFKFRLPENAYVNQKNESSYFYSSSNNSPPGSYHYPQAEENYWFPPSSMFFKICSLHSMKKEEETT